MLGVAGLIGADARVPAMVLMRAPLGRRGSWGADGDQRAPVRRLVDLRAARSSRPPSRRSPTRCSDSARSGSGRCSSAGSRLALALLGPIDFVRKFVRKFAVWAVLASLLYLTWWALDGAGLGGLWDRDGEGGSSVLAGRRPGGRDHRLVDPARRRLHALQPHAGRRVLGPGLGYFVPSLGSGCWARCSFFSRDISRSGRRCSRRSRPAASAAMLALLALTVDETDEAFANVYSTAVSIQNLAPRLPQRVLVVAVSVVATLGALTIDLLSYQTSCSCSARSSCRSSASCSRTGSPAGATTASRTFRRPGGPARDDRRLDRRLCRLPVAVSDRAALVGRPRREARAAGLGHRRVTAELRRLPRAGLVIASLGKRRF